MKTGFQITGIATTNFAKAKISCKPQILRIILSRMNIMMHVLLSLFVLLPKIIAGRMVTIEVPRESWSRTISPWTTTSTTPWTSTWSTTPWTTLNPTTSSIPTSPGTSTTTTSSTTPTTTTKRPSCGPNHDYVLKGWVENIFYTGDSGDGIVCYIAILDESSPLSKVYHASFSNPLCNRAEIEMQKSYKSELWSIDDKVRGIPVAVGIQRAGWEAFFRCNN